MPLILLFKMFIITIMEELTEHIKEGLGYPIIDIDLSPSMVETYMEIAKEDLDDLLKESNVTMEQQEYDTWVRDYTILLGREGMGRVKGMYVGHSVGFVLVENVQVDYETLIKDSTEEQQKLREKICMR